MSSDPDRPAFTGWHRPGVAYPWRRIVQAESEDECWCMLIAAIQGGDLTVTASHRDANERQPDYASGSRYSQHADRP